MFFRFCSILIFNCVLCCVAFLTEASFLNAEPQPKMLSKKNVNARIDAQVDSKLINQTKIKVSEKAHLLQKVNTYLNNIRSMIGFFTQEQTKGTQHSSPIYNGHFWLKRPLSETGRMRIDYEKKKGQVLFANASGLTIYNFKEKSVDNYSIEQTPAYFILKKHVNLRGEENVRVLDVFIKNNHLYLSLETDQSKIEFRFLLWNSSVIKYLVGWTVTDSQGLNTIVRFDPHTIHINDSRTVQDSVFLEEKKIQKMFD